MNNLICIAGPTASGKTALSIALAKKLDAEIVSCDSMQVYRRMDIGTAKPTLDEREGIVHHMLDVAEPDEDFSVRIHNMLLHAFPGQSFLLRLAAGSLLLFLPSSSPFLFS